MSVSRAEQAQDLLGSLADLHVTEHPAIFEHIQQLLRDELAGVPAQRPSEIQEP